MVAAFRIGVQLAHEGQGVQVAFHPLAARAIEAFGNRVRRERFPRDQPERIAPALLRWAECMAPRLAGAALPPYHLDFFPPLIADFCLLRS